MAIYLGFPRLDLSIGLCISLIPEFIDRDIKLPTPSIGNSNAIFGQATR